MATVNLSTTVWVQQDPSQEPVSFGPGEADVPKWALDKIGDHCFEDGQRPGSGDGGYEALRKADLEAEVSARNEGRADEELIVVGGSGTKADLVAALEADDQAQA